MRLYLRKVPATIPDPFTELDLGTYKNAQVWIGLAWGDVADPIPQTIDIGETDDGATLGRNLTNPERNALETFFDEPNGTFDGMRVVDVVEWAKDNDQDFTFSSDDGTRRYVLAPNPFQRWGVAVL